MSKTITIKKQSKSTVVDAPKKETLNKKNLKEVAGNDLALDAKTKYFYPTECNTTTLRKAFRTSFRKKAKALNEKLEAAAKSKKPEEKKMLDALRKEYAALVTNVRPDLVTPAKN